MTESSHPSFFIKKKWGPVEIKEKGSRFISTLYPVGSREEALEVVSALRKEYHDATHVCFAMILKGDTGAVELSRDDGEPSGTAGAPILSEIRNRNVCNVLLTVVRYFGGTKLGSGGLIRAYGSAAKKILEQARLIELIDRIEFQCLVPFHLMGKVHHLCAMHDIILSNETYGTEGMEICLSVRVPLADRIRKEFTDISQGTIQLEEKKCPS